MRGQAPSTPDPQYRWTPGADPRSPAEIDRFFHSPAITHLSADG